MKSGSAPKRSSLSASVAVVLLFACLAVSPAAEIPDPKPDAVTLLPKDGDVEGWNVYPDTLAYAAGEDLTDIYDGGYQLYTKNGVLDAAQQIYRTGDDTAIITVHRMASLKDMNRFFDYWRKSDKKQSTYKNLRVVTQAYVYTADGTANSILIRRNYFVTVSVNIDEEKGRSEAERFVREISRSIGELVRSKKQEESK